MRKGIIMLAAAMLFSLVSFAQNLETVDVSKESDGLYSRKFGDILIEGQVKNGQKDGVWCEYYVKKEMLHRMAQYQKGKLNGVYIEVDELGALLCKKEYVDDKLEGSAYVWASGGRLTQKNTYKKGEFHGEQFLYYDNGNSQEISNYKNGKRDGVTTWYNREGAKRMMITYKNGLFDGLQETYYPTGGVKSSKMFKNNVEEGVSTEYYEGGDVKSETTYKNGKVSGKPKTYSEKHPYSEKLKEKEQGKKVDEKVIIEKDKKGGADGKAKPVENKKSRSKKG